MNTGTEAVGSATEYRDVITGFYALPRLVGDRVDEIR